MIFSIPVDSRIKKFISKNYGENFKIDQYTFLLGLISRSPVQKSLAQPDLINIEITPRFAALTTMSMLWDFLDGLFWHQFTFFVEVRVNRGDRAFDAIRDFCDFYEITEDEFPQETARRMWQRHLSRKKKQSKELTPMIHESI